MKKILLVEDEAHVVSFIKKGLYEEGFEVTVAFDGKSGLNLALENTFDLIVLDIMLPEINGYEVCKEIRRKTFRFLSYFCRHWVHPKTSLWASNIGLTTIS